MTSRGKVVLLVAVTGLCAGAYLLGVATGVYELFPFGLLQDFQDRIAEARAPAPDLEQGEDIFRAQCAVCHGAGGEGGYAPELTITAWTADEVETIVDRGIPGTEMPGSWMPRDQREAVAAYVVSLQGEGGDTLLAEGDSARGNVLFSGEGGCQSCHSIQGRGGRNGPDLSGIGDRRSIDFLMESLVDPASSITEGFRWASIETAGGTREEGFLVGLDPFNVRLFQPATGFHSTERNGSLQIDSSSIMPSYASRLSRQELTDLVAFLAALRR